jgi:PPOX class probable F420-dependent enzyme
MDIDTVRQFIAQHHKAAVATLRRDGLPALTPVTVGLDDEGRIEISSRETAYKVHHLRRDPRLFLCVFTDRFFGDWVQVDGIARIVPMPDALEPLVEYYRRISGEHPDWDDYRRAMVADQRVLIRVEIVRVGPNVQG